MGDSSPARHVRVRPGAAVWREIDGETVLLALDASEYLGLNRSATALWPAMVDGATTQALTAVLCGAYDVTPEVAEADVDAFVATCAARGLLCA